MLADVARLRIRARASGISDIVTQGNNIRFGPVELADSQVVRLKRLYPRSLIKPAVRSVLVPKPTSGQGFAASDVTDTALLEWCMKFLNAILPVEKPDSGETAGGDGKPGGSEKGES